MLAEACANYTVLRRQWRLCYWMRNALRRSARYIFAIGRYYALAQEIQQAREYTKRAIKMDGSLRAEFLEDSAFDSVWDSF